ncbi:MULTISPECIES: group III truncated hemoglobin [Mycobacteroides]|uniref:group III truncated hemoglobin n=1 Tax=Mycobacteroides TaxID=670516 RepID=UPI0008A90E2B|nr:MULTISPECIES: group III truncated hemoglobin [Mycobacteroides]OHU16516.1 hypothetical protein BKG75_16335 [Mycobacteroides chelonae]TDZ91640.1 hypothetical protein CCUG62472_03537 [Mycobacteroides salmoniphilum]
MLSRRAAAHTARDPRPEIAGRDDIDTVVRSFYARALADELLFTYFLELRFGELEQYIPKMCDFWDATLFKTPSYREDPLHVHLHLNALYPLQSKHFERWIELWIATIDAQFAGPVAARAKKVAAQMACALQERIVGIRSPQLEKLLHSLPAEDDTPRQ